MKKDDSALDKPAGRNPEVDFKGEKRSNATHQSSTDTKARLYKKGEFTEGKLSDIAHALADNRHGLVVAVETTQATGAAAVQSAQRMIRRTVAPGSTVSADKGYDQAAFIECLAERQIKAHVARKQNGSAVDGRAARSKGYVLGPKRRKMIEEAFGWLKTVDGLRKTHHRGCARCPDRRCSASQSTT